MPTIKHYARPKKLRPKFEAYHAFYASSMPSSSMLPEVNMRSLVSLVFVAKYVITSEGLWRDRVVEMMEIIDYYQVKL